ncbi:MAG: hypothetical protein ACK58M_07250 [Acidobacteriota bacterium]
MAVVECFVEFAGLLAAGGGDAVEAEGVAARVVVAFPGVVAGGSEGVAGLPDLEGLGDEILGFEVFAGELVVIPEGRLPERRVCCFSQE